MNKNMTFFASLLLLLLSPASQAAENVDVKNGVQQQVQTQTRNMSGEKNAGQGTHLQNMESMTEQERSLYQQLNSSNSEASQNRYGKGNGDGSGKKKRQRKGEGEGSGGDYYSPRGSGGGGGGKGRGY